MNIKLISLETVGSTSTHAQSLISDKLEDLPFAVFAKEQTDGRGRLGKSWQSPSGNLAISFALPNPATDAGDGATLAPIKVALLCCGWLQEAMAIKARIKWPNDLLWQGKKLGGILCETSVQGQTMGPLVIGIGINVNQAPTDLEYGAVSLRDIASTKVTDAPRLAASLVTYFETHWQALDAQAVHRGYEQYALGRGALWVAKSVAGAEEKETFYLDEGIGPEGSLKLRSLSDDSLKSVESVNQAFAWYYQSSNQPKRPLLLADVGNSQMKLAHGYVDDTNVVSYAAPATKSSEVVAALKKLYSFAGERSWPVYCVSVNDKNFELLERSCAQVGLVAVKLPKLPRAVRLPHYKFSDLGADRLAAMEGFVARYPGKSGVVVSLGTAVTIDVVNADGTQQGGWILPGLQTSLSALHEKTGKLPQFSFKDEAPRLTTITLGKDTRTAMVDGAVMMIRQAVSHAASYLSDEPKIVLCGGDAKAFAKFYAAEVHENLVIDGAKMLVLG
jgi:BirA family biotin operon repressor/biotin-[acetyl-CoA-carboxylase] ligase